MNRVDKYAHLNIELPELPIVLLNTIQSEFLEIKGVNKDCDKFKEACKKFPVLKDAFYVVYSSYVKKSEHEYEKFVFLDEKGKELCDLGGRDFDLYGLLLCVNIPLTEEYVAQHNDA